MVSESIVIVASILLALSADTWLDARRQADRRDDHLVSLARDFEQMSERANESLHSADKAAEAGKSLLSYLNNDQNVESGRELQWLGDITFYEVFSPSVGAYEALVASGDIELLDDSQLVRELADFFGSFEDMRASERLLLDTQLHFIESETFSRLAGDHRLGIAGLPSAGEVPIEQWKSSDRFMHGVAHITLRQIDVLADYRFLVNRTNKIRDELAIPGTVYLS